MISVVVQCQKEVEEALYQYWTAESFSLCSDEQANGIIAGIVYGVPRMPIRGETEDFLNEYLQRAKSFVHNMKERVQRPAVCIVLSSTAVYGPSESTLIEGAQVADNMWARWIQRFEEIFSVLETVGVRVVYIRSGVVVTNQKIHKDCLSSGKPSDWLAWVGCIDLVRFIDICLRAEHVHGMYHLVAPHFIQKRSQVRKRMIAKRVRNLFKSESIFFPSQKIGSCRIDELDFQFLTLDID